MEQKSKALRLAELLRLYQPNHLEQLLRRRGESFPTGLNREKLVERVSESILAPGRLEDFFGSLSPAQRKVLYSILFFNDGPLINAEDYARTVSLGDRTAPKAQDRHPFRHLRQQGVLYQFALPSHRLPNVYVIPEEILERLSNILIDQVISDCGVSALPGEDQPPGQDLLTQDLLALLLLAAPEGIPLTRYHVPYRKVMRRFDELLSPVDFADEVLCEPFWFEDRYPSLRMEILFRFAEAAGLLVSRKGRFAVAPGSFEKLRESLHNRFPLCMQLPPFTSAPHFLLRQFIADVIRRLPMGVGLDPKLFLAWSDPFHREDAFSFDLYLSEPIAGQLWKMLYMGILQVVYIEENHPLLARTQLGTSVLNGQEVESSTEKRFFVVQPNFELLCDPSSLAAAGEKVSRFVEPVSVDRTFLLRFTRKSVQRALRHGHSIASCYQALQAAATKPVPENVLKTLEEWNHEYRRVFLRSAVLIQVETKEQADVILGSSVAELIREEISPTIFSISFNDLHKAQRRLSALKIDVINEVFKEEEELDVSFLYREPIQKPIQLKKDETPEYYPVARFETLEKAYRKELKSGEIVPPSDSDVARDQRKERPLSSSLKEIRGAITTAILEDRPLRLIVYNGKTRKTEEQIVQPICWGPGRGRFAFYGVVQGKGERRWRLDGIVSANVLSEQTFPLSRYTEEPTTNRD